MGKKSRTKAATKHLQDVRAMQQRILRRQCQNRSSGATTSQSLGQQSSKDAISGIPKQSQ